jgi:hypothetical protein
MPVFKQPKPIKFTPQTPVEMHFHDHDETWVVMGGRARAHAVGRDGQREDFVLEAGDIWMVEAGVEHGCDPIDDEVLIFPFAGTIPEGSHTPGHYYLEQEGYMPALILRKTPLNQWRKEHGGP